MVWTDAKDEKAQILWHKFVSLAVGCIKQRSKQSRGFSENLKKIHVH